MNEFINKLIDRLEETRWTTIFDTSCIFENSKLDKCIEIVNQLAEEYKHCALCYLQSPCEYQNAESSCEKCEEYNNEKHYCPKFCYVIENAVKELKEHNNGWIPCSEQEEPTENGKYFVYVQHYSNKDLYDVCIVDWFGEWKVSYNWNVIAWMPLPAPYQPKGE